MKIEIHTRPRCGTEARSRTYVAVRLQLHGAILG